MRKKLENFAKKYGLFFLYYINFETNYTDITVHYHNYILDVVLAEYTRISIIHSYGEKGSEDYTYSDLKSAFKAFRKIMRENQDENE